MGKKQKTVFMGRWKNVAKWYVVPNIKIQECENNMIFTFLIDYGAFNSILLTFNPFD